jgi:hypothetical protein
MGTRDERVEDLFFEDLTVGGNPTEEGQARYVSGDLVAYVGGAVKSLTTGSGLSPGGHKALRDLIHFIDEGPADGFVTGAYKESVFSGAKLTNETWWESAAKSKKIVQLDVTYTGVLPTTEVWKMYDTDGTTVLVTLTDAVTYSGVFEDTRTRTWV